MGQPISHEFIAARKDAKDECHLFMFNCKKSTTVDRFRALVLVELKLLLIHIHAQLFGRFKAEDDISELEQSVSSKELDGKIPAAVRIFLLYEHFALLVSGTKLMRNHSKGNRIISRMAEVAEHDPWSKENPHVAEMDRQRRMLEAFGEFDRNLTYAPFFHHLWTRP